MEIKGLRSSYDQVGGLYHFGRMLDKIRLHAAGQLPEDYHANLGSGFDGRVLVFLHVNYEDVKKQVLAGLNDEAVLQWCFTYGRQPTAVELEVWNAYVVKFGWKDTYSQRLAIRKAAAGWADREDIQTFFDLNEVDEDRPPRMGQ
jgi:hypothetical protein